MPWKYGSHNRLMHKELYHAGQSFQPGNRWQSPASCCRWDTIRWKSIIVSDGQEGLPLVNPVHKNRFYCCQLIVCLRSESFSRSFLRSVFWSGDLFYWGGRIYSIWDMHHMGGWFIEERSILDCHRPFILYNTASNNYSRWELYWQSMDRPLQPPNYSIWIFTHLKLCLADAIPNFKWVKIIQIWQNGGQLFSNFADWCHILSLTLFKVWC